MRIEKMAKSSAAPGTSPGSGDTVVNLNFKVPVEFRKRMKIAAVKLEMTQTELLQRAVDAWLKTHGK